MPMTMPRIDETLCTRCGRCVAICPSWAYERDDEGVYVNEDTAKLCVACGHCMAVCPTRAVTAPGLDYSAFADLPPDAASPEALSALLMRRRSVRAFTDESVPREVLQRLVDAAATAPMCFPPSPVEVTVLPERAQVAAIMPEAAAQFESLAGHMRTAPGRFMLRRMAGEAAFTLIRDYMQPFIGPGLERYRRDEADWVTWGAPAMLLFHAPKKAVTAETDCLLAACHAMLMGEALQLGTIMLGWATAAIQFSPDLRARFGIPSDNAVRQALAVGYAQHQFQRAIPRTLKSIRWVEE